MNANMNEQTTCLVTAFKLGDDNAFSSLYNLYVQTLIGYGSRLTTDKELLKDCIHDVFVKIYSKRTELGMIENIKSYLCISLKNKLCDELRKRMNMTETAVEDFNPASETDNVEFRYLLEENTSLESAQITYLLSQLSPRQREALTLYYLEERKYDDICSIMNMNYQSVRNLMHRGMSRLRELAVN